MITIQLSPGASVDQRLAELTEIVCAVADAVGVQPFSDAMNARLEARKAAQAAADKAKVAEKEAADKATLAVPDRLKRGRRK